MISVCIATHNGENFISEQILSILPQLSENDEIIISDDGSTDHTLSIINEINDKRIRIVKSDSIAIKGYSNTHYKVTHNFENALSHASGDYIFFADQDDIWNENKVEKIIPYLNDGYLVQSNCSIIDKKGVLVDSMLFKKSPISSYFLLNILKQPFHGCCMAFPRTLLNNALPFPKNLIMHDNWIGLVASLTKYKIKYIPEPLIQYRRHNLNVSPSNSCNPFWFRVKYRLILLYQLLKRIITKTNRT